MENEPSGFVVTCVPAGSSLPSTTTDPSFLLHTAAPLRRVMEPSNPAVAPLGSVTSPSTKDPSLAVLTPLGGGREDTTAMEPSLCVWMVVPGGSGFPSSVTVPSLLLDTRAPLGRAMLPSRLGEEPLGSLTLPTARLPSGLVWS